MHPIIVIRKEGQKRENQKAPRQNKTESSFELRKASTLRVEMFEQLREGSLKIEHENIS